MLLLWNWTKHSAYLAARGGCTPLSRVSPRPRQRTIPLHALFHAECWASGPAVRSFIDSFIHSFNKYLVKVGIAPTLCAKTKIVKGRPSHGGGCPVRDEGQWWAVSIEEMHPELWELFQTGLSGCGQSGNGHPGGRRRDCAPLWMPGFPGPTRMAAALLAASTSRNYLDLIGFIYKTRVWE